MGLSPSFLTDPHVILNPAIHWCVNGLLMRRRKIRATFSSSYLNTNVELTDEREQSIHDKPPELLPAFREYPNLG